MDYRCKAGIFYDVICWSFRRLLGVGTKESYASLPDFYTIYCLKIHFVLFIQIKSRQNLRHAFYNKNREICQISDFNDAQT